jgi:MFS family permease
LMLGLLATSILSGRVISRTGRYKVFPIVGTFVMTIGLLLLSRLGTGSSMWAAAACMLVVGVGIGMTMQVLVLAVQNSVDHRLMGVATSGAILFRQIGGSIGVALFGTIFANRLHVELAARLPEGVRIPKVINPAGIRHLPPAAHAAFADAVAAALHPVFIVAGTVSLIGFALTWLLREVPLRTHALGDEELRAPADEPAGSRAAA